MDIQQMPLAELAAHCREETGKFLRRETTSDAYCFEIFRRAICDRDEPAWRAVFAQYRGIVLSISAIFIRSTILELKRPA